MNIMLPIVYHEMCNFIFCFLEVQVSTEFCFSFSLLFCVGGGGGFFVETKIGRNKGINYLYAV